MATNHMNHEFVTIPSKDKSQESSQLLDRTSHVNHGRVSQDLASPDPTHQLVTHSKAKQSQAKRSYQVHIIDGLSHRPNCRTFGKSIATVLSYRISILDGVVCDI